MNCKSVKSALGRRAARRSLRRLPGCTTKSAMPAMPRRPRTGERAARRLGGERPGGAETIIKAMGGGLVGGSIGAGLSESDRRTRAGGRVPRAGILARRAGGGLDRVETAAMAQVAAAQPYRVGSQDCRQYTHTVVPAGRRRRARHRLPQRRRKLDAADLTIPAVASARIGAPVSTIRRTGAILAAGLPRAIETPCCSGSSPPC